MKTITVTALLSAIALSVALNGCAPGGGAGSTTSTPPAQDSSATKAAGSDPIGTTLHQYIVDNNIAEVRFTRGEPGTPRIEFPFPPGWSSAGDRTPGWAYGAIVFDRPQNPQDPPYMVAIASKLTGDVDQAKILEYAPGQLNKLPDFTPFHEPKRDSLSGFAAMDYAGTYVRRSQLRVIGQQTIVVPGPDALFVLQLNADAPQTEKQPVIDAAKFIAERTKISVPS